MKKEKDMWEVVRILDRQSPNRNNFFWKEVTIEKVVAYKKQLLTFQEWLKDFWLDDVFYVSKERLDYLKKLCEAELELCEFYLSYPAIERKPNFNLWVEIKEEIRKEEEDKWRRGGYQNEGDALVKSDGKVKAVIEVKDNITSTKVTLSFFNDSRYLEFYPDNYNKRLISEKNLRNEDSIKKEVERLKEIADRMIAEYQLPNYSTEEREWEIYKQLVRYQ